MGRALVDTSYALDDRHGLSLAVASDIHERKIPELLECLKERMPDYILIPGDIVDGVKIEKKKSYDESTTNVVNFLDTCSLIAPTFFSLGNHERVLRKEDIQYIRGNSKATLLDDEYVMTKDGFIIGGLSSACSTKDKTKRNPNESFISEFADLTGFKVLLSHHPEYYEKYLADKNISIIISGHAHGGQVRIGDQGLFAPGQGLFPKYTSGVYYNRFIISRGIAGTELFPRINNRPEIVYINI